MELRELNADEDMVLVALMREVVQADGAYSDAERRHVAEVRAALGEARFDAATVAARERFPSRDALKQAAKTLVRPEARARLYDTLEAMARADGKTAEEEKPLRWLASWWELG
jgi:uncharacterized tellurite resistance protein B-like protein